MKTLSKKEKIPKATDKVLMDNIHTNLHKEDFLSYKELANLIGLKYYTGGKSKQLQLEDLHRFIDYEYDENEKKYLITNIKETYDKKPPRKLREDAIYTKYIEMLLISYLMKQDGYSAILSKKMWWLILSMVNQDYVKYQNPNKRNQLLEEQLTETMDRANIDEFIDTTDRRFTTLFTRALDSLKRRFIIEDPQYVYIYRLQDDDYGNFRIADDKMVSELLECQHDALKTIGLKTEKQLLLYPNKYIEYYNVLADIEYERYGLVEVYRELKIIFGKKHLQEEFDYTKKELLDAAIECNKAFKLNIDNSIINKYKKNSAKLNDSENMSVDEINEFLNIVGIDTNSIFLDNNTELKNYMKNQLALSNRLIKKY